MMRSVRALSPSPMDAHTNIASGKITSAAAVINHTDAQPAFLRFFVNRWAEYMKALPFYERFAPCTVPLDSYTCSS